MLDKRKVRNRNIVFYITIFSLFIISSTAVLAAQTSVTKYYDARKGAMAINYDTELYEGGMIHSGGGWNPSSAAARSQNTVVGWPNIITDGETYGIPVSFNICGFEAVFGSPGREEIAEIDIFQPWHADPHWQTYTWYSDLPMNGGNYKEYGNISGYNWSLNLIYGGNITERAMNSYVPFEITYHNFGHESLSQITEDNMNDTFRYGVQFHKRIGSKLTAEAPPWNNNPSTNRYPIYVQNGIFVFNRMEGSRIEPYEAIDNLWIIPRAGAFTATSDFTSLIDSAINDGTVYADYSHPEDGFMSSNRGGFQTSLAYARSKVDSGELWATTLSEIGRYWEAKSDVNTTTQTVGNKTIVNITLRNYDVVRFGIPYLTFNSTMPDNSSYAKITVDYPSSHVLNSNSSTVRVQNSFVIYSIYLNPTAPTIVEIEGASTPYTSGIDINTPVLTIDSTPPVDAYSYAPITISATTNSTDDIYAANIIYQRNNEGRDSRIMDNTGANQWQVNLGPFNTGDIIKYYVSVTDNSGRREKSVEKNFIVLAGYDNVSPEWKNQGQSDSNPVRGSSVQLFAEARDNAALSYAILSMNETGVWENKSAYGSPMFLGNVFNTWVLSNFTWQNPSITVGTKVAWRIYYNDTIGNINATDIMSFTIRPDITPPVISVINPVNRSILQGGILWTWINISTNEPASCRYSTNPSFTYASGTGFTNGQGTTLHSFNFSGLIDEQTYHLYYLCNDTSGNINAQQVHHQFGVGLTPVWWNSGWYFRIPITIDSQAYSRTDHPIELDIDFVSLLNSLGVTGTFDSNSVRVIEYNIDGSIADSGISDNGIPSQFDDANADGSGVVYWIMKGVTLQNTKRYYQIYFDITENIPKAAPNYAEGFSELDNAGYIINNSVLRIDFDETHGGCFDSAKVNGIETANYASKYTGDDSYGGLYYYDGAVERTSCSLAGSPAMSTNFNDPNPVAAQVQVAGSFGEVNYSYNWTFYTTKKFVKLDFATTIIGDGIIFAGSAGNPLGLMTSLSASHDDLYEKTNPWTGWGSYTDLSVDKTVLMLKNTGAGYGTGYIITEPSSINHLWTGWGSKHAMTPALYSAGNSVYAGDFKSGTIYYYMDNTLTDTDYDTSFNELANPINVTFGFAERFAAMGTLLVNVTTDKSQYGEPALGPQDVIISGYVINWTNATGGGIGGATVNIIVVKNNITKFSDTKTSGASGDYSTTYHLNTSADEGIYNINVNAYKSGWVSDSDSAIFRVGDANPAVVLNYPADNYWSNKSIVMFSGACSDDNEVASVSLYGDWSGSWNIIATNSSTGLNDQEVLFTATLPDGNWKWNYLCTDNASQQSWGAANRTIHVDTVAPTVTIQSPVDTIYNTTLIYLNYTVSEQTSWCAYSLDGGANITLDNCVSSLRYFPNGEHNLVVYAKDLAANTGNSASRHFIVNSSFITTNAVKVGLIRNLAYEQYRQSLGNDYYSKYVYEILKNIGVPFDVINSTELNNVDNVVYYDVLVIPPIGNLSTEQSNTLHTFVSQGRTLIGFRPDSSLLDIFGVTETGMTSNGFIDITVNNGITNGVYDGKMYLFGNLTTYNLSGATKLASLFNSAETDTGSPALSVNNYGIGKGILFAFDLGDTVVRHQQPFVYTDRDGDGGYQPIDTIYYYNYNTHPEIKEIPQADELKKLLRNSIIWGFEDKQKIIPLLWYWQNMTKGVLTMTHDSDGVAEPQHNHTLDLYLQFNNSKLRGTFFIWPDSLSQFSQSTLQHYLDMGMDVGPHTVSVGQNEILSAKQAVDNYIGNGHDSSDDGNRDHGLRWTNDPDNMFLWFENAGFLGETTVGLTDYHGYFGTGFPYYPMGQYDISNRYINMLEVPVTVEDDCVRSGGKEGLSDAEARIISKRMINDSVNKYHGVIMQLHHPVYFPDEDGWFTESVQFVLNTPGANLMKLSAVNYWWKARYQINFTNMNYYPDAHTLTFTVISPSPNATGVTITVPVPPGVVQNRTDVHTITWNGNPIPDSQKKIWVLEDNRSYLVFTKDAVATSADVVVNFAEPQPDTTSPTWMNQGQSSSGIEAGGSVVLYAQANDDNSLSYAVLSTNETGIWENKSTYGSPMGLGGLANIWVWSNFTWQNPSILPGTKIAWRIYYNDSSGNWNATDVMSFTILTDTTPPVINLVYPPNGTVLPKGIGSATINISTNENAHCRYSNNSNFLYEEGANFTSGQGTTLHSFVYSELVDGQAYDLYYLCNDTSGNVNTERTHHLFSVSLTGFSWWNANWRYRVPITVNASAYDRINEPIEHVKNFTMELILLGRAGLTFDENSVRVVEYDANGQILGEVPSQFDKINDYDASNNAVGTIVWIMNGTTPANTIRHYYVYFDTLDNPKSAPIYSTGLSYDSANHILSNFRIDATVGSAGGRTGIPSLQYNNTQYITGSGMEYVDGAPSSYSTLSNGPVKKTVKLTAATNGYINVTLYDMAEFVKVEGEITGSNYAAFTPFPYTRTVSTAASTGTLNYYDLGAVQTEVVAAQSWLGHKPEEGWACYVGSVNYKDFCLVTDNKTLALSNNFWRHSSGGWQLMLPGFNPKASSTINPLSIILFGETYQDARDFWNRLGNPEVVVQGNPELQAGDLPPTVVLNFPSDNYWSNNSVISFNGTCMDDGYVVNVSLYSDWIGGSWSLIATNSSAGLNGKPVVFTQSLPNGNWNWKYECYDNASQKSYDFTRKINIDTITPIVTITSPNNNTQYLDYTVSLSYDVSESGILAWCGYSLDSGQIVTLPGCSGTTLTLAKGQHNIVVYANDSAGNMGESGTIYFTAGDIVPPQYSDNSTNSTNAGENVEFRLKWTDNVGLDGYVFSFDNGSGVFVNDSFAKFWKDAPSSWWNFDWSYRKEIAINNTGAALANYQVLINLDTASLMAAGKMNRLGGDMRFVDSDDSTEQHFWVESGMNSSNTKVWVEVPGIPASASKKIFMYYGNADRKVPQGDGTKTFPLFDNFGGRGWEELKYDKNPVLGPGSPESDTGSGTFSSVIRENATFWRMYSSYFSGNNIGWSNSSDGLHWTKRNIALPLGGAGAWDSSNVWCAAVWKENDTYYMLYSADGPTGMGMGLATSSDGNQFTKYGTGPVFKDYSSWIGGSTEGPCFGVLKENGIYYLVYGTLGGLPRKSSIATSTNLINWTPVYSTARFGGDASPSSWNYSMFCGNTFKYDDMYYLVTPGQDSSGDYVKDGLYVSPSPIFPYNSTEFKGIVLIGNRSGWDAADMDTPWMVQYDGKMNMYYGGTLGDSWSRTGAVIINDPALALTEAYPAGNYINTNRAATGSLQIMPPAGWSKSIAGYLEVNAQNFNITLSPAVTGRAVVLFDGNDTLPLELSKDMTSLQKGVISAWMRRASLGAGHYDVYAYGDGQATLAMVAGLGSNGLFHYWNGGFVNTSTSYSANTWYLVTMEFDVLADKYNFVVYDTSFNELVRVNNISFGGAVNTGIDRIKFRPDGVFNGVAYLDDVRARNFNSPEPYVSLGSELEYTTLTEAWSNVTKMITSTPGATIRWRVYANDTNSNWGVSDIYSFVTKSLIEQFNISLYTGWNLISLPLQPYDTSVAYIIRDLSGQIVIWYYNASTDSWTSYDTAAPFPWLNTLQYMSYGNAYWLKSTINQNLIVQGAIMTDYNIILKPGWNFVGYKFSTTNMPDPIAGLTTPIVVWTYYTPTDEWKSYDTAAPFPWLNTLTNMTAGKGYWLKSSIEQNWTDITS